MKSKPLPQNAYFEVTLRGRKAYEHLSGQAVSFFLQHGFALPEVVSFDSKSQVKLCVYTRSLKKVKMLKAAFDKEKMPHMKLVSQLLGVKDWLDKWKWEYHMMPLGRRFVLIPYWERGRRRPSGKRLPLVLEPKAAFGSGTHETTRHMIRLMEKFEGHFESFLDVGTGTGILSVAAWRLGARTITGLDRDKHSVEAARENLRHNQCGAGKILKTDLGHFTDRRVYELVSANLMTDILIRYQKKLFARVGKGRHLIVSGVSLPHLKEFRKKFGHRNFRCLKVARGRSWAGFLFKRIK